jgi:dihydroneopterin aldolase
MIGTAGVKNLRIDCVIGILPEERHRAQTIEVDIEFDYDFAAAAAAEDIAAAVDYAAVARSVQALAESRRFRLIETMAEETAAVVFAQASVVRCVRVEVRKPAAIANAACSFVRLERVRA